MKKIVPSPRSPVLSRRKKALADLNLSLRKNRDGYWLGVTAPDGKVGLIHLDTISASPLVRGAFVGWAANILAQNKGQR